MLGDIVPYGKEFVIRKYTFLKCCKFFTERSLGDKNSSKLIIFLKTFNVKILIVIFLLEERNFLKIFKLMTVHKKKVISN